MDYIEKLVTFFKKPSVLYTGLAAVTSMATAVYLIKSQPPLVKLTDFLSDLNSGKVKEVVDFGSTISFKSSAGTWSRTNVEFIDKSNFLEMMSKSMVDYSSRTGLRHALPYMLQIGFMLALYYMLNFSSRPGPKRSMRHQTAVTFADIAGNQDAKIALQEIIEYFKNPEKFLRVGAKLPRGVLLYGPPGTGKTMLAKATANEAGVNFIQTTGSEYIEIFVGVGAKRVREIFAQARENSPCILFIDEIESLAMKRESGSDKANLEHLTTINQLLTEMDGFVGSEKIVVLAATNNHRMIDEAILRPGRFDRKIMIKTPDVQERVQIFNLHLKNRQHKLGVDFIEEIAGRSEGMTGADVAGIINEACYISLRGDCTEILPEHITEAFLKFHANHKQFNEKRNLKDFIQFA